MSLRAGGHAAMDGHHLLNLVVLLVVIVGHLLLVRGLIARLYRYAMPWSLWVAVWFVMLSVGLVVPWVLVQRVGLHGPRVLRGGNWARAPVEWQIYGGACVVAFLFTNLRRYFPHRPRALVSDRGETVDVAGRIGTRPAAAGPRRALARLPGNELFHVEIAERELALPALPPGLDGLSVLHLSDLHFNGTPGRAFFEHAIELALPLKPDLLALTGDILDRHAMKDWLPTTLGRLEAPLGCYFVLGNHDALDEPEKIRAAMTELGWVDVGGCAVTRQGPGGAIFVAGTERPWLGADPPVPDPALTAALRLLLSHTPEQFAWGAAAGFDLVLAGHLHGGQIDLPLFGPISGGRYQAGVFSSGRTVMHVSRGLGAMFPVRWNCPAEITELILRRAGQPPSVAVGMARRR